MSSLYTTVHVLVHKQGGMRYAAIPSSYMYPRVLKCTVHDDSGIIIYKHIHRGVYSMARSMIMTVL